MLSLIAAYKDIPEETAAKLLSNDLLIDRLRATRDDEQFQAQVESAIASENQALIEERAALAKQLEALRSDKERVENELERQKQESAQAQEKMQAKAKDITAKLNKMQAAREAAEKATEIEVERRRGLEARALRTAKMASIIVAIFVSLTFTFVVHYVWRWDWLLSHPNSYGLQGCLCLMVSFATVGLWVRPWRKALWVTGVLGVLLVALQILGGPAKTP